MERPIKIFVEGIADIRFIENYVDFLYGIKLSKNDAIETKGWNNLITQKGTGQAYINQMNINSDNGGINLVIFDADTDAETRRSDILKWKKENSLDFELFLFPNDKDTGALEDLLEQIINPKNSSIFGCLSDYEMCLGGSKIEGRTEPLTTPAKKTKIYGYLEALLGKARKEKDLIKEANRNYLNEDHWNLSSEALNPLKDFLDKYFKDK
nr:DUF3226 domain-containing protein [uncultured Bacteroides sp.]